jgi:hypothetical protein
MQHQDQVGRARIVGYALGLAAVIAVAIWKFLVR